MENNEIKGGGLEFTFDAPSPKDGLVFETKESSSFSEPATQEPKKPERQAEAKSADDGGAEEFTVPEAFSVNEKYNTPIKSNERTRIYTTYVPRFTGIADTYRMKDDPRPRPKNDTPQPPLKKEEPAESASAPITVSEITSVPEFEKREEFAEENTVVVNIPNPSQDDFSEEAINIFKFPVEDLSDADRMNVEEENANRRALEELKARQAQRRAEQEAERLAEEEAERIALEARRNTVLSPEDYEMPDPERTGFVDRKSVYGKDAEYDTPHGIPTDSEKSRKLKLSEYTSAGQRDSFKDRFLDSLVALRIRIVAVILLGITALLFENSAIIGFDMFKKLSEVYMPSAKAIIDFQLVLCTFLLTLPETVRAVRALIKGVVFPELSLPISFIIIGVYTLIVALSKYYMDYPVFGLVFIICALLAITSSYLRKRTDFENFKFISVKGEKKIIEYEETRKYARTMLALDGAIDGYKSNTAKTFRTNFVSDFFLNSSVTSANTKNNLIMIASYAGVALVSALVAFFTAESRALYTAAAAFTLVSVFAISAISYIWRGLSYYYAGKQVASENSAFIGEGAYTDAAGVDVIVFEDTEIFGEDDVNLKRFGFYGNEDSMNKSMRLISSLFASVGGPLNIIFSKTLEKRCTPANDPVIEADGVSANVDGKTVCAGTAEYMQRRGIKIPEDNERSYGGFGAESMKIMYGAEGDAVFAKFYIRYSFSEEFTSLLPAMREEHIVPLVYTSDPNVSNELFKSLTMCDCMRVMKRTAPNSSSEKVYPRLSAKIVTAGDKVNAIKLVLIAGKYKRFSEKIKKAEIIAMASGTALAAILAAFGFVGIPTLALGAVQLLSAASVWIFVKKKFGTGKKQ